MNVDETLSEASESIAACRTIEEIQQLEVRLLGRKGSITTLLKSIGTVPASERKSFGQRVNQVKQTIQDIIQKKRIDLQENTEVEINFDITLPGKEPASGSIHPTLAMMDELNEAFLSLGFSLYEGPEISSEAFCFDNLNFPPDHPARESMDTYWLEGSQDKSGVERLCLRPHLTGGSVRFMQMHEPPMRFVYPGRVYRSEATDASHERAFFQYEALIIDREVPFSSGQLLVNTILERVFGTKVKTRMRAGFFPFVEPGFEIDMECLVCGGKGCSVCKHVGWLEMMPGGPPHPNVLKAGNIDPDEWQGFYINIGLDRLVMMRHGIDDVRLFHSADLRFMHQFSR